MTRALCALASGGGEGGVALVCSGGAADIDVLD